MQTLTSKIELRQVGLGEVNLYAAMSKYFFKPVFRLQIYNSQRFSARKIFVLFSKDLLNLHPPSFVILSLLRKHKAQKNRHRPVSDELVL